MADVRIGMTATIEVVVGKDNCAARVGSGSLEVFATPMLVAAMEKAACMAVQEGLAGDETSVGTLVNVQHLAPTPPGGRVKVTATLVKVEGRALSFEVEAHDAHGQVGRGTHERCVVNAGRFMEKAATRAG